MRRVVAGILGLVVAGSTLPAAAPAHAAREGLTWPLGPSSSSQAPDQPCASVLFVGVRGSGEPVPYGDTVTRLRNNIVEATAGVRGTAREVWLEYPASNPHLLAQIPLEKFLLEETLPKAEYFESVREGAATLRAVVADSVARCPRELIVVGGFSQGSDVIARGLTDADPSHFAGVVVAGNPANSPVLAGQRHGVVGENAFGISASLFYLRASIAAEATDQSANPIGSALAAALDLRAREVRPSVAEEAVRQQQTRIAPGFADRWHHVCLGGDLACDTGPALSRILAAQSSLSQEIDTTRPIHLSYNENVLRPASSAIAEQIRQRAVEPAPQPAPVPASARTWLPWLGLGLFAAGFGLGSLVTRRKPARE